MIGLVLGDDSLGCGDVAIDGHGPAKPIDHPVFGHPELEVLSSFLDAIPPPVRLAGRHELHDDRGDILCKAYQLSNGNPIQDTK